MFLKNNARYGRKGEDDLLRSFNKIFQVEAMKDNKTRPLFPIVQDLKSPNIIDQEIKEKMVHQIQMTQWMLLWNTT
jgi:hypothetical protein